MCSRVPGFVLALAFAIGGCTRTPPAADSNCYGWGPWDSNSVMQSAPSCVTATIPDGIPEPGKAFFALRGGALASPIDVPLWIEVGEDPEEKCHLHDEWFFFQIPDGRLYIGEYNSWCGTGSGCRLLDPVTRTFTDPGEKCIPAAGVHWRARSLGGSRVEVHSDSEGVVDTTVVTWTP